MKTIFSGLVLLVLLLKLGCVVFVQLSQAISVEGAMLVFFAVGLLLALSPLYLDGSSQTTNPTTLSKYMGS